MIPGTFRGLRVGNAALELVVDAGLDHLHIAVQRCRRHRRRGPVRERKEIVLKTNRPMGLETVFEAGTDKPAIFRARPVPSLAESVHLGGAMYPSSTDLAVDEPLVVSEAKASRCGTNPMLTDRAEGRKRKRRMIESRPVKIAFDANQKVAGLKVVASLDTANEFGEPAVEIVAWNIQITAWSMPRRNSRRYKILTNCTALRERTGAVPSPPCRRRARGRSNQLQ